jgi:hypothetical protein
MVEPMKPDQFARRLLYLNGQGGSSQEFWSSASEARRLLDDAEEEARAQAQSPTFSIVTGDLATKKVVEKYERAEKKAREALAIATAKKREAEAVAEVLKRVRRQLEAKKNPMTPT